MNLVQIEAIGNKLIRNVLATCWNFAEEVEARTDYGSDVHHHLFNRKHYSTCPTQTKQDTECLGVWDCIKLVINYEKRNFGEIYTSMDAFTVANDAFTEADDAFTVANMVNFIAGYILLGKSEHLMGEAWDRKLTLYDKMEIQTELRAYIEELSDWTDFWAEVCDEYDV